MPGKRSRERCWLLAIDAIHALRWLWSARAWHRQHQGPLGCGHPGLEARDVGCLVPGGPWDNEQPWHVYHQSHRPSRGLSLWPSGCAVPPSSGRTANTARGSHHVDPSLQQYMVLTIVVPCFSPGWRSGSSLWTVLKEQRGLCKEEEVFCDQWCSALHTPAEGQTVLRDWVPTARPPACCHELSIAYKAQTAALQRCFETVSDKMLI